jgi:hypothetical protein
MTPSGIDPATFRFVAQCLNHCATACPHCSMYLHKFKKDNITVIVSCEELIAELQVLLTLNLSANLKHNLSGLFL